jgi:predicted Zn finger-like uncharacterized protein
MACTLCVAQKTKEKMSQLRCPKCKAMHFNVQATDLQRATGEVECSNCGHILKLFSPAKPPTSRLETDGRSAAKVTLALPVENNSTGAMCVRCAKDFADCDCKQSSAYFSRGRGISSKTGKST